MVQYFHLTSIFTANLSLLTMCVALFLTSSFISGLRSLSLSFSLHTSSARLNPVLVISYLCWIDLLSLHLSGGFSETYAALCDYNGIGCKEEVQWVRKLKKLCKSTFVLFFNRSLSVVQMEKKCDLFLCNLSLFCSLSLSLLLFVSFSHYPSLSRLLSCSVPGC